MPSPAAATTAELRRRLRGTLLEPGDRGWFAARSPWNPRLDVSPRAIAFCETAGDVAEVVRFAGRSGLPGHAVGCRRGRSRRAYRHDRRRRERPRRLPRPRARPRHAELADWPHAYFGDNLPRLQAIKRRYDPHGRFVFAQGVTG